MYGFVPKELSAVKEVVLKATSFYCVEDNAVWAKRGEPHRGTPKKKQRLARLWIVKLNIVSGTFVLATLDRTSTVW